MRQLLKNHCKELPAKFSGDVSHDQLRQLYHVSDLFILPSIYPEPFGLVNIEAGSAGLPVIASSVGGIPDVIIPIINGLLVPPGRS